MANNVTFLDYQQNQVTFATTNTSGVQYPHNMSHLNVANADVTNSNPVPVLSQSANVFLGWTGQVVLRPFSSFTRPNNNTTFSSGQLVANSTTNTSVVPLSFTVARYNGGGFIVYRAKIKKSSNVTTNANFRLHRYNFAPTITAAGGDGTQWLTNDAGYYGSIDVSTNLAFSDSAIGIGTPNQGNLMELLANASSTTIAGLIECRGAYVPANSEVFTVALEGEQY
jgi:hypothetical protein